MNSGQKNSILFGLFVIFFMILLPPWKHGGYGLIFDPPAGSSEVDFARLGIQVILAGIISGALFLISKPTVDGEGKESTPSDGETRKSTIVLVSAVFALAIVGVFGAHTYLKQQDAEKAQAAEKAALERINHQRAIVAVVANQVAAQKNSEEEKELLHLKKLASTKVWRVKGQSMPSVNLTLQTYWKSEQMYYKLVLRGAPEALEYAADSHPVFQLSLINGDQVPLTSIQVSMTELQPIKGRSGSMNGMISPNSYAAIQMEDYEKAVAVRLDN
ncbi:MAG: hypothetical protein K2Y39_14100 [Candidatus Obscuribacterales bacterium]|nr:hypothetical protein [Candidatus Obscuribacterales bacterium]